MMRTTENIIILNMTGEKVNTEDHKITKDTYYKTHKNTKTPFSHVHVTHHENDLKQYALLFVS